MKWRNSKERELLASGGSRDQTLPNKNNPNPDLSDAKCDRPITPLSPGQLTPPQCQSASPINTLLLNNKEETKTKDVIRQHQQQQQQKQQKHQQQQQKPSLNLNSSSKLVMSPKTSCSGSLQSPSTMHHIPQSVSSVGISFTAAAATTITATTNNIQKLIVTSTSTSTSKAITTPPPPLLTMASKLVNSNGQMHNQLSNDQSLASTPIVSSSHFFNNKTNNNHNPITSMSSTLPLTMSNAEFQAKINAEMHKHLMAADLKFKLESTLQEAKQRRLNMLTISNGSVIGCGSGSSSSNSNGPIGPPLGDCDGHPSLMLSNTHPANNFFISNAMQEALQHQHNLQLQQQQQQHHQQFMSATGAQPLSTTNCSTLISRPENHENHNLFSASSNNQNQNQNQNIQNSDYMKMYYDDYDDDSNSDSDEEISVT